MDLPPHRGGNFSFNRFTTTYVGYFEPCQHWAAEATPELGFPAWPDEIERALFEGP